MKDGRTRHSSSLNGKDDECHEAIGESDQATFHLKSPPAGSNPIGLPLRGRILTLVTTGCTRYARFTRGYDWRTLRVQYVHLCDAVFALPISECCVQQEKMCSISSARPQAFQSIERDFDRLSRQPHQPITCIRTRRVHPSLAMGRPSVARTTHGKAGVNSTAER